nr:TlpA disulfide reductase family protein [Granulicella arctica]
MGSEELPLNGVAVPCRILQVDYKSANDEPVGPDAVTYSICSEKHLVLKKTFAYSTSRRATDPPAQWTLVFDSAQFNRPAPEWLINVESASSLTIRKEWIGHAAPEFALSDLSGMSVKLSSMQGKVVLLDFWSITCPPCIREMPMVEAMGESYRAKNVVLWGVSFDLPDKSKKWLLQHQHSLPTLSDTDFVVSDLYTVHGIPSLILVGRDGKIKNYWEGEVPQADLEGAIRQALKP